jgi:hypothetical protein
MRTKLGKVAVQASALACLAFAPMAHAGIETNGGFETGDFTGWTQFGDSAFDFVDSSSPHSGSASAFFGAVDPSGVSQTLTTIAGQKYEVSFWLANEEGTPNAFSWSWNGVAQAPSFVDSAAADYTNYSSLMTATGTATELSFSFQNQTNFWRLDDVQVTDTGVNIGVSPVPEPETWLLLSAGLGVLGLMKRRRSTRPIQA